MEESYMTLAEAVNFALTRGGADVMNNPSQFLSYIADVMDPESVEMRVLVHFCDRELLEPYRESRGKGLEALYTAEVRARDYLEGACRIEQRTAVAISAGITEGVARFQGEASTSQPQSQQFARAEVDWGQGSRPERGRTLAVTPGAPVGVVGHTVNVPGLSLPSEEPYRYTLEPLSLEPGGHESRGVEVSVVQPEPLFTRRTALALAGMATWFACLGMFAAGMTHGRWAHDTRGVVGDAGEIDEP